MKLFFKQNAFTFLGNAEIYNENGQIAYTVRGQMSWGRVLKIFDSYGREVGTVKQVMMTFLPKFEIWLGDSLIGCIRKTKVLPIAPSYEIDYNGWTVEGNAMEWDYIFRNRQGREVAHALKEPLKLGDQYTMVIEDSEDADPLTVLMFVIAMDAEKASRN